MSTQPPSEDWNGFLALAEQLQKESDHAALRTAISRAYYAMYNTAVAAVRRCDRDALNTFKDEKKSHEATWAWFVQKSKPVKDMGDTWRRKRNQVDYDQRCNFDLKLEARAAIAAAKKVIGLINNLGQTGRQ